MFTDGNAAGGAPARIVFPSLRASGPANEQAGYTEGHAAGYAAGVRAAAKEQRRWRDRMTAEQAASLAAGQQDLDRAVRALAVARADFAHRNVQALHDAEEVLARTALELAEAILGYELAEGTRTARGALHRALSGNDAATVLAIRLNPADIEVLAKEGQDMPAGLPLLADPALNRGDAKVEYQQGWFDASLGSALARARAALLDEHAGTGNPPGETR
jgi:flagellar assembly protein FliH